LRRWWRHVDRDFVRARPERIFERRHLECRTIEAAIRELEGFQTKLSWNSSSPIGRQWARKTAHGYTKSFASGAKVDLGAYGSRVVTMRQLGRILTPGIWSTLDGNPQK
jgi:hypothetical protein